MENLTKTEGNEVILQNGGYKMHTFEEVKEVYLSYISDEKSKKLIEDAYAFVCKKHAGIYRKSGEPYVHHSRGSNNLLGPPFELLSDKAVKHYEKLKEQGENVFIDTLSYEQFMLLGDAELSRRFSLQDEAEQKDKLNREQGNELEYVDESEKEDDSSTGNKPVRNQVREKPSWEDTIMNRMLHWSYSSEQKEEVKMALAAGVPKETILTYFYPETPVEKMREYRK